MILNAATSRFRGILTCLRVALLKERIVARQWLGLLIRQNAASRVASLFYLAPLTAIEAFLLFNERLGALALVLARRR
jgi:hypothetical protein